MGTISIKRALQEVSATYTLDTLSGVPFDSGNISYLPLIFDNFEDDVPNISVTGATLTSGQGTISVGAGQADNVRVGDTISAASGGGTFTAPATLTRTCVTLQSLPILVYAHTLNSGTLGVHVGDAVSGTGIPVGAKVDRIDYAKRHIYLTANCTATASGIEVTVTPPVRVTAVRASTATSNANQIDINTTVDTGATGSTLTVVNGANEAVHSVLRIEPINNTTGARANFLVGVSHLDGKSVRGSANGLNNIDATTLTYTTVGTIGFDSETFLANARVPKPTAV